MITKEELETRKKIVKVGKILSIATILAQAAIILLYMFDIFTSSKETLFLLCILPWVRYIYGLIYSDVTIWDENEKRIGKRKKNVGEAWKQTHMQFYTGWISWIQCIIVVFDMIMIFSIVQPYKGIKTILYLCGIAFAIMMIIGFFRIQGPDKGIQLLYYGMIIVFFVYFTVSSVCYYFSSSAVHEECTFVSKSVSHSTKGGDNYYVTVKLQDGTTYESLVSSDLYDDAEDLDLVACHRMGPFDIEYLRVHEE